VTGPTGTGKTTTLYAALQHLNDGQRKINTLEDPIEFAVPGFLHLQVQPKVGLDFPELLRGVLRQAPDVVMIGEIRDEETARTAVRAATSGHLVFATLHAPIAAVAVHSLLAVGVPPHFLASSILGVVAQRLVRTLCPHCRMEYDLADAGHAFAEVQNLLGAGQGRTFFGPGGCEQCLGDGYLGRTGVFEVLQVNRRFRQLIADSRPALELHDAAVASGMTDFRRAALVKVAQGLTSMEEVLAAVPYEHLGLEDD
ncbi:MAG: Flp pilus assembly complex ATPase component TadA, partial [Planctomycetales bacterium]|nr:Flp pilus assembly complex ATPase component TadA [Planctomycetales bacterium]